MRHQIILVTVLLIFSCFGCDLVPPTRVDSDLDTLDLKNYYPLQIGNVWRYELNELNMLSRTIIDTVRDNLDNLTYKASFGTGIDDTYEYYYWDDFGLHEYLCGVEDTCRDVSGNDVEAIVFLSLKTPIIEGEYWHAPPTGTNDGEVSSIEIISVVNHTLGRGTQVRDTLFYDVAQVTTSWSYYTNPTRTSIKQYAKNFGLIKYVSLSDEDTLAVLTISDYHLE